MNERRMSGAAATHGFWGDPACPDLSPGEAGFTPPPGPSEATVCAALKIITGFSAVCMREKQGK